LASKKKYEKGQTWPVGDSVTGLVTGLMMTFSDKELREGIPAHKNVVDGNKKGRKYITPREFLLVPLLKLIKYTYYPAGKALKTDTEIRAFRTKVLGKRYAGGRVMVWTQEKGFHRKKLEWQVRKWK